MARWKLPKTTKPTGLLEERIELTLLYHMRSLDHVDGSIPSQLELKIQGVRTDHHGEGVPYGVWFLAAWVVE